MDNLPWITNPDVVVEPCGCEWHRDDTAGLWYPCDRAKKNRLDFCPLTEMSTDSKWRDRAARPE